MTSLRLELLKGKLGLSMLCLMILKMFLILNFMRRYIKTKVLNRQNRKLNKKD